MGDDSINIESIKKAIFERMEDCTSVEQLVKKYNVPRSILNPYYNIWAQSAQTSQPQSSKDIHIKLCEKGRKTELSDEEEKLVRLFFIMLQTSLNYLVHVSLKWHWKY